MAKATGFSVRIFVPSGEPESLRLVEKSNWTGQGLVFPRSLYAEVRKRKELSRTGVYILWGPGDSGHLQRVYVGEGDTLLPRLDSHRQEQGLLGARRRVHEQEPEPQQGARSTPLSTLGGTYCRGETMQARKLECAAYAVSL